MKQYLKKRSGFFRDVSRLIVPMDVVCQIGNMIYRRSLRYTFFTAGIAVIGILTKTLNLPGLTIMQAVILPLMVGGFALVVGYTLKVVPRIISSRLLTVAQASGLNLMEDYRKSQADEHLEILWDRLYRHECRMRITADFPAFSGLEHRPDETEQETLQRAKEEFLARAKSAFATHQPQIRQLHDCGLDMRYIEDWRDGAYLDRSDTKLIEQFEGDLTLISARREVGLYGVEASIRFRLMRIVQGVWFFFITRMVAIEVGIAVQYLSRRYDTDLFNAQVILWPGEENENWLDNFDGAREAVIKRRRRVIRRIFGPDIETACKVLDHMLYGTFVLASELRMRYDVDYCDDCLGYNVVSDTEATGHNRPELKRVKVFTEQARNDMRIFDKILQSTRPTLFEPQNAEALRSVRIVLHINRKKLKQRMRIKSGSEISLQQFTEHTRDLIDQAIIKRQTYTRRLIAVRMHHELSRMSRSGYQKLLKELYYNS